MTVCHPAAAKDEAAKDGRRRGRRTGRTRLLVDGCAEMLLRKRRLLPVDIREEKTGDISSAVVTGKMD